MEFDCIDSCTLPEEIGGIISSHNIAIFLYKSNLRRFSGMKKNENRLERDKKNKQTTKRYVCPERNKISMRIRPLWSEYSLCAIWVAKDPTCLLLDGEVFSKIAGALTLGAHAIVLVLSCSDSTVLLTVLGLLTH